MVESIAKAYIISYFSYYLNKNDVKFIIEQAEVKDLIKNLNFDERKYKMILQRDVTFPSHIWILCIDTAKFYNIAGFMEWWKIDFVNINSSTFTLTGFSKSYNNMLELMESVTEFKKKLY